MIEACADVDDADHGEVPRRQARRGHRGGDLTRAIRKGTCSVQVRARAVRLGVQEQGRAAAARRGRQLPAVAARHSAGRGHRTRTTTTRRVERKADDNEPFAALAFKIIERPVRRQPDVLPRLLGHDHERHERAELDARQARAHRPHPAHARQQARRAQGVPRRQHLRGRRPARHAHRRHAVRREDADPPREDDLPGAGHLDRDRAEDPGRPRQARRQRCRSSPTRIPSFRTYTNEETGQTIIAGMGELHLEIIVDRLKREFKVEANVGKPEVAYREAIAKKVDAEYKYVRQSGGHGQYGHVQHRDRARRARRGLRVRERHRRRRDPEGVHPVDREGHPRGAWSAACSPATRSSTCKARLYDGSYHEVDSSGAGLRDRRLAGLPGRLPSAPACTCSSRS